MPKSKTAAGCLIPLAIVWIGGWSAATLTFDSLLIAAVYSQLTAFTYPSAAGEIVSIDTGPRRRRGESLAHKTIIHYRYTVDGQEYHGDTGAAATLDFGTSNRQRNAGFSTGKKVLVYYNPHRPGQSLLWRGLDSGHALIALFLMPFNVIMLTGWLVAWDYLVKPSPSRPPRGVKLRRTREGFRLMLYEVSPLTVAMIALLAGSFIGMFGVAFGQMLIPESVLTGSVWLAVICFVAWLYFRQRRRARVLDVNELRGIVQLRDKPGEEPTLTIPLAAIAAIEPHFVTKKHADGDSSETYCVSLIQQGNDGPQRTHEIISGWTESGAEQLARWLRARLQPSGGGNSLAGRGKPI